MDLQISVILLLSFSLAATIKGEKTEEEGTFRKERSGRNVQQMVQSDGQEMVQSDGEQMVQNDGQQMVQSDGQQMVPALLHCRTIIRRPTGFAVDSHY